MGRKLARPSLSDQCGITRCSATSRSEQLPTSVRLSHLRRLRSVPAVFCRRLILGKYPRSAKPRNRLSGCHLRASTCRLVMGHQLRVLYGRASSCRKAFIGTWYWMMLHHWLALSCPCMSKVLTWMVPGLPSSSWIRHRPCRSTASPFCQLVPWSTRFTRDSVCGQKQRSCFHQRFWLVVPSLCSSSPTSRMPPSGRTCSCRASSWSKLTLMVWTSVQAGLCRL
mmetsp:Transcript_37387/g.60233  ORF Transcript_37387/g.60233 Transcript_37387/m.60233 type:complete len:224 (+) Transcript_37387:1982-2653(+)